MSSSNAAEILAATKSILVIDWPSRDVPETLARRGFEVVVQGGPRPEDHVAYERHGDDVIERKLGRAPEHADLVYSYRPLDELPDIIDTARSVGAKAVWTQSGVAAGGAKDAKGCWRPAEDSRRARELVEAAGLRYVDDEYIVDAAEARRG